MISILRLPICGVSDPDNIRLNKESRRRGSARLRHPEFCGIERPCRVENWLDSWLKYGALPLALVTLLLTLLGYGYDFDYLEVFGLRPEDLQRTPFRFNGHVFHGIRTACS